MRRILITGAVGFIGHHVVEHLLQNDLDLHVVCVDRLDSTSTLERFSDLEGWPSYRQRVKVVWHDLRAPINASVEKAVGEFDDVIHLAAGTHVDRSISEPLAFVFDNVVGTAHLLDWLRGFPGRVINFSTDEVFGPAPAGVSYKEWDRHRATNPYSAAKSGAAQLGFAFHNTYGLRVVTTYTMNVFGERQHGEKFIPMTVKKVLAGEEVVIHADPTCTHPGSRFYTYARDVARALEFLLRSGDPGDAYNIVGAQEVTNLQVAQTVAQILGRPLRSRLVDFHSSRPGHDLRYALDGSKLEAMGFQHAYSFERAMQKTVRWFVENPRWL